MMWICPYPTKIKELVIFVWPFLYYVLFQFLLVKMRLFLIYIFSFIILLGQARIGDWDSFTSPLNIHEIIEYQGNLVCATEGGLLIYDTNTQSFQNFDNMNGLTGSQT